MSLPKLLALTGALMVLTGSPAFSGPNSSKDEAKPRPCLAGAKKCAESAPPPAMCLLVDKHGHDRERCPTSGVKVTPTDWR